MKKFFSFTLLFIITSIFANSLLAGSMFIWKPAGASRSFNSAGNWKVVSCGGTTATTVPTTGDSISFSSCSNKECHMDVNVTVDYITVVSGYTDTIYQDNGYTFTFGTGSFKGGVFMGGNSAISCTNSMTIDGTAFTSTSDVVTVTGDFTYKTGGFTHNNGKVVFNKGGNSNTIIKSTSNSVAVSFYKVEFGAPTHNTSFNVKDIDMQVNNELKLSGDSSIMLSSTTNSVIQAKGDIVSSNKCTTGGGGATIEINGTGSQTLSDTYGTDESGKFPNIKINKSSGTLSLSGSIAIGGSAELNYVAAGSLSAGTSSLILYYNNTIRNNSGGSMNLYNLEIMGNGGKDSVKGTITVTHHFLTSQTGNCNIVSTNGGNGTIEVQGDLTWNNTATSNFGNVSFKCSGSASQTFNGSIEPTFYNLEINKSGGSVTLSHALTVSNNLNLVNRNIVTTSTNLLTLKNGATVSNGSASSYVSGPIKKVGNSAFTFPVGNNFYYGPIAITAPSSASDGFTAEYFHSQQAQGSNKDSLTSLSTCEYWNLDRTTGSSNVKVTLGWEHLTCNIYTLSTLRIARWDGSKWNNLGMCTTTGTTLSGSIQTNSSLSSFGYFLIAKRSPAVYAHAGSDVTFCGGSSESIGASPSATGGLTPYSYSWSPATGLSSSTGANPTASPTTTTSYILTVTDLDHSTAKDTVVMTVHPKPIVDAGKDTISCKDMEFNLGGEPTADDGTSPYAYTWINPHGDTLFKESNPYIEADTSLILYLTVIDSNECTDKDTIEIAVANPIEVVCHIDTTLYLDQYFVLNPTVAGGEGSLSYQWKPRLWLDDSTVVHPVCTPLSSIHYKLIVEDSIGCTGQGYATVNFSPVDMGLLSGFSVYASDSIIVGDSSVAVGGVGALYVDTAHLHILAGNLVTDRDEIQDLGDELLLVINRIDTVGANIINADLTNDTLTSGIYRINNTAVLNGALTLVGNDSSYFIFDMDSDWIISDHSEIIHIGVANDKVFFSINGSLIIGDSAVLNCSFLCKKRILIGSFTGHSIMASNKSINISSTGLGYFGTLRDQNCYSYFDPVGGFLGNINVSVPWESPASGGPPNPSDYSLIFYDYFIENDLSIVLHNDNDQWSLDPGVNPRVNHKWYEWCVGGDVDSHQFVDPNENDSPPKPAGVETWFLGNDQDEPDFPHRNLVLRTTNLLTPFNYGLYDWIDAEQVTQHAQFITSLVESNARFYHGYFEIKAKLPYGQGMWPSFWVFDGNCYSQFDGKREIDFFDGSLEKNQLPLVEHTHGCAEDQGLGGGFEYIACFNDQIYGQPYNLAYNWHLYACDWNSESITFFVDNIPITTVESSPTMPNDMGIRDEAMYLLLGNGTTPWPPFPQDLNITGTGSPDNGERDFQIDYVKVWQKKDHLADFYLSDVRTETKVEPDPVPNFYLGCAFKVETTYEKGSTYEWSCSPNLDLPASSGCYPIVPPFAAIVCVNSTNTGSNEWIKLKVTRVVGHWWETVTDEKTLFLNIIDDSPIDVTINCSSEFDNCTICGGPGHNATFEASVYPFSTYGMNYQWRIDGDIIPGATQSIYEASLPGVYSCNVYLNGNCAKSSNTITLTVTICRQADSTYDAGKGEEFIYPNPTSRYFSVDIDNHIENDNAIIELMDLMGTKISSWQFEYSNSLHKKLMFPNELPDGLYFLNIITKDRKKVIPIELNRF